MSKKPIQIFKVTMSRKVSKIVSKVLASGMVGEGSRVIEFKEILEARFNNKRVLPLNSCTSAITLAGRLIGLKPGDEVISPAFTMIATNVALMSFGIKIVWADTNPNNANISADDIEKKITKKTKAIVVTHVGGVPCDMERIRSFGIPIISDCAHAVGTYYKGKHISHWADYSCFSFQAIKQLNTGDGGALVVQDKEKYELAEKLKWFGMTREVPKGMTRLQHQMSADVPDWGYKFHMNDIAAAIGLANIKKLDWGLKKQRDNARFYFKHLSNTSGVTLPSVTGGYDLAWWVFYIFVDNRDLFIKNMAERGIVTTPMWRRNDEYSTFKNSKTRKLINIESVTKKIVFIPVGWWVSKRDRKYIAKTIKEIVR